MKQSFTPSKVRLDKVKVLVITSGHEATDHRVYAKEACSWRHLGATVTIVGHFEHGVPEKVTSLRIKTPSSRLVRFLWQPWRSLWAARRLNADIIHFHDPEMLVTLLVAKFWWFRTRFVYDVHEDFANLMLVRDWLPSWVKPLVRVLTNTMEKSLASLADAVVGVTPPLTDKFGHSHRIVAYNYPAREFFEQASMARREPQMREFDLVHLGTLNSRRAIFLADTICEFHQLRPKARSLVIGASPAIAKVMKPRVPDRCLVLAQRSYEEIPALLSNAKIGIDVHPWLGPHLKVALPVKVCEYMAAGCGVVSSSMPVLDQILEETRVGKDEITMIDGGRPSDYAQAVLRLVETIERGDDPGSRLGEYAFKHMVWEKEATKIAQLYLTLLGKPCAA